MNQISFQNTFQLGQVIFENEDYKHIHFSEMLSLRDSNYIEFKKMPSVSLFREAEDYLSHFHQKRKQKFLRFSFPDNLVPVEELQTYLKKQQYDLQNHGLYAIQPSVFPRPKRNSDIKIVRVTEETLDVLLKLKYQLNLEFGVEFAEAKRDLTLRLFKSARVEFYIAFFKDSPSGCVDVIFTEELVEIDDLNVLESFQRQGIGSHMQQKIMDVYHEKTVILIADQNDTPKEMYLKQKYKLIKAKCKVQKILD